MAHPEWGRAPTPTKSESAVFFGLVCWCFCICSLNDGKPSRKLNRFKCVCCMSDPCVSSPDLSRVSKAKKKRQVAALLLLLIRSRAPGADWSRLGGSSSCRAVGRFGVVELFGGLVVAVVAGADDDGVDGRARSAVASPPALSLRRHSDGCCGCETSSCR